MMPNGENNVVGKKTEITDNPEKIEVVKKKVIIDKVVDSQHGVLIYMGGEVYIVSYGC